MMKRRGYNEIVILSGFIFLTNKDKEIEIPSGYKSKLSYANFCLGFVINKKFAPSVALLNELMDYEINKVFIDDNLELNFVYGKDIVLNNSKNEKILTINKEKMYLVINNNNCVGFGRLSKRNEGKNSRGNNKEKQYLKQALLRNVYDIGFPMRKELKNRIKDIY